MLQRRRQIVWTCNKKRWKRVSYALWPAHEQRQGREEMDFIIARLLHIKELTVQDMTRGRKAWRTWISPNMYNVSKFDIFTWIGCWRGTIEADLLPAGVMVAMGVAVLPMVTMVTAVDVLTDAKLKWILIENWIKFAEWICWNRNTKWFFWHKKIWRNEIKRKLCLSEASKNANTGMKTF
jgi:hypothetical protein